MGPIGVNRRAASGSPITLPNSEELTRPRPASATQHDQAAHPLVAYWSPFRSIASHQPGGRHARHANYAKAASR